jgi:hypothetical protein
MERHHRLVVDRQLVEHHHDQHLVEQYHDHHLIGYHRQLDRQCLVDHVVGYRQ